MWSDQRKNTVFGDILEISVRCRTKTRTLGTTPGDPDLLSTYIASKAADAKTKAEEIASSYPDGKADPEAKEKMITVFPKGKFLRRKDNPKIFYDPIYGLYPPEGVETEEVVVPFIWDYQWRGSAKESIAFIQRASKPKAAKKGGRGKKKAEDPAAKSDAEQLAALDEMIAAKTGKFACTSITAYKKVVDGGWFIKQRRIPMLVPETWIDDLGAEHKTYDENGRLPIWTRQLRADTAQGPRVCLASSEFVPEGTEFYFTAQLFNAGDKKAFIETMDFKEKVGMLQWRGGGNGTLIWTLADEDGNPVDRDINDI